MHRCCCVKNCNRFKISNHILIFITLFDCFFFLNYFKIDHFHRFLLYNVCSTLSNRRKYVLCSKVAKYFLMQNAVTGVLVIMPFFTTVYFVKFFINRQKKIVLYLRKVKIKKRYKYIYIIWKNFSESCDRTLLLSVWKSFETTSVGDKVVKMRFYKI